MLKTRPTIFTIAFAFICKISVSASEQCGYDVNGTTGVILSPNYPHMYGFQLDCYYTITAPAGTVVFLEIQDMHTETNFDFVYFYDGPLTSNSLLATYTGTFFNVPINATTNQVLIHFTSDGSNSYNGFNITFESSELQQCGYDVNGTSGYILSPNYPNNYDNNLDCYYNILTPENTVVSFEIQDMQTEINHDYVNIYDGLSTSDQVIISITGTANHIPNASTNQVLIQFTSDGSNSNKGFNISFASIETEQCGGEVAGSSGNITSPNYPDSYYPNLDCYYSLSTPENTAITLEISHLSLEDANDFIEIFDGPTDNCKLLGNYTGSYDNITMYASTNQSLVYFHTDSSEESSGFEIIFKERETIQCGGEVAGSSGNITSPNYPDSYYPNLDCYYSLSTPENTAITLEIFHLSLEDPNDFIEIFDGPTENCKLLGNYTGSYNNVTMYASTNQSLVYFHTDSSEESSGFEIIFKERETIQCGGEVAGSSGNITSPNYPDSYYPNLDCYYSLSTPENTAITLEISQLSLEDQNDFIEIFDGPTDNYKLLGNYTGSYDNITVYASTNQSLVYFHTDSSVESTGFEINFMERELCAKDVTGTEGAVISQGYPEEPYTSDQNCYYKVITPENTAVDLNIVDMDLEEDYDYIEIYDGPTTSSLSLGRYSGVKSNVYIYASTNEALIYFHSNSDNENKGYYIYFTERDQSCPAIDYTAKSGALTSPLYPNMYPNNTDCHYSITTSLNTQLTLQTRFLQVESSLNCSNDYVEVFDGSSADNTSLAKLCGSGPVHDILSSSNEVFVHFHSDSQNEGKGFNITYSTNPCPDPNNYYGDFGTIYSPGFPVYNYPNDVNCLYSIDAPLGSKVQLTVVYMSIQSTSGCSSDIVRIYDGPTENDPLLIELCENQTMSEYQASSNRVLIEFNSDSTISGRGFVINYVTTYYYEGDKNQE